MRRERLREVARHRVLVVCVLHARCHEVLQEVYRTSIADAPASASPLDVLAAALQAAAALHEPRPDLIRRRHLVIAAHPTLQEREHLKRATVADTITAALHRRGIDEPSARLLGEIGPAVFKVAYDRWVADAAYDGRLGELVAAALGLLTNVITASVPRKSATSPL
jgi:hypothetical protein